MSRTAAGWVAALLLAACDGGGSTLVVDLRTDYVPGTEVSAIETRLDGAVVDRSPAFFGDPLLEGRRAAEIADVAVGTHDVTVRLLDPSGAAFAERTVRVEVSGAISVTVLITRSCAGVTCPGSGDAAELTECLGGICVPPTCTPENPADCPPPACDACEPAKECTDATCVNGVCFQDPRHERCDATQWCSAELGCQPLERPDGGPPGADAGSDAGASDAGVLLDAEPPAVMVSAVGAGRDHACAIADGRVYCWGSNVDGQLGRAEFGVHPPAEVSGITDAIEVACGIGFSCALRAAGDVVCWGSADDLRLGRDAVGEARGTVGSVDGLSGVDRLWVGGRFGCASASGLPICWGQNDFQQAVYGMSVTPIPPTPHADPVVDLALSDFHGCRVPIAGTGLDCWGQNEAGELGDGTTTARTSPTAVPGIGAIRQVAVTRGHDGADRGATCAVLGDGAVVCWGSNSAGQLGSSAADTTETSPLAVEGLPPSTRLSAGARMFCARTEAGETWCWGQNTWGELGRGFDSDIERVAAHAPALDAFDAMSFGFGFGCGITGAGRLFCWGNNAQGQVTGVAGDPPEVWVPLELPLP